MTALKETGFFYRGWKDGGHQFDTANGKVSIGMNDGVRHHVLIGGIANQVGGSDSLKLLYRVMLTADVDESRQAAEFNRKHSMWVYVMDETVIKGLLPEVEISP